MMSFYQTIVTNKLHFLRYKVHVLALTIYSLLTIFLTYPVAFSLEKVAGWADVYQFLWFLWWFKESLFNHTNPFFTSLIYYPSGVSLVFSPITPSNGLLSTPLQLLFGLVTAYNLILLLSFIISGFGMFLLVRYLTDDVRAAFIAGLIFMFAPSHFAHALGQLNLISIEWIPFYVLFLIKIFKENKIKNSLFAGIFLTLIAFSDYQYLIFMVIFTSFYIIYEFWDTPLKIFEKEIIKKMGIMILIFGLSFSPFAYLAYKEMISGSSYFYVGGFVEYSADLLSFFTPSPFHPVFRNIVVPIYQNFTGNYAEGVVFIGFTCIFLVLLSIFKLRIKEVKFWTISLAIYFILCLGPILHINGTFIWDLDGNPVGIVLPYALLMKMPVFSLMRVPSRWDILVMLSIAVLAGYGLQYIFSRLKGHYFKGISLANGIGIIIAALILFEFLAIPMTMSNEKIPDFYYTLAKDPDNYAILEIPNTWGDSIYMYYQTVHHKKLVNGYPGSRVPDSARTFIQSLLEDDILKQNVSQVGPSILNYYDIRYVVLHPDWMSPEQVDSMNIKWNGSGKQKTQIFEDDRIIAYKFEDSPKKTFMLLNNGWYGLENWSGTPSRWVADNASLFVYSDNNKTMILNFQIISFYHPRTLEIIAQNETILKKGIPPTFIDLRIPIPLQEGENLIYFSSLEGSDKPIDIKELKNRDTRNLSFALRNLSLVEK